MEPGLGVIPTVFKMQQVISVWPKPSTSGRPVLSRHPSNRSGLSASPAVVQ